MAGPATLGETLKVARTAAGLSLRDVERRTGVRAVTCRRSRRTRSRSRRWRSCGSSRRRTERRLRRLLALAGYGGHGDVVRAPAPAHDGRAARDGRAVAGRPGGGAAVHGRAEGARAMAELSAYTSAAAGAHRRARACARRRARRAADAARGAAPRRRASGRSSAMPALPERVRTPGRRLLGALWFEERAIFLEHRAVRAAPPVHRGA